jgi:hypothetical protein
MAAVQPEPWFWALITNNNNNNNTAHSIVSYLIFCHFGHHQADFTT